ncbi:4-hydroxyphenylacetate catabolism regulatory protein HpaA [Alteromonas gilva]|uniref:4-hydroxyphenylacetate catabolism regulatory protein HpaA n=1 Tax=Alteromonas gilva TaxID=2987522 RepID=A0ABT5L3A6_9ALTE|nr:4-hydroxyphenylacetate catabolism regulatory protein HpaA [Alteromonas gilva]MDC8830258.1 4-hydroxyphenylacetate catabolism regulatory protein HpaA [Alteromonas gilva]
MTGYKTGEWIPNINIGKDYDRRFIDASIHYDSLTSLASFFGRDMSVHRHAQHLQIHFIDSGDTHFHIDDKIFRVSGPSLFLTPPAIPHSFCTQKDVSGHVLTIHQSLVWQLFSQSLSQQQDIGLSQGICLSQSAIAAEQDHLWQKLTRVWSDIADEWQVDMPERAAALQSHVSLMLIYIIRLNHERISSMPISNDDIRVYKRFSSEVETHYKTAMKVPDYASKIGVSESRLTQICQRVSHSSPKQNVRQRRLQEIKRLLTFTQLSITEIAFEMGFSNPAYFTRFFKKEMHMTPLEFRKHASQ